MDVFGFVLVQVSQTRKGKEMLEFREKELMNYSLNGLKGFLKSCKRFDAWVKRVGEQRAICCKCGLRWVVSPGFWSCEDCYEKDKARRAAKLSKNLNRCFAYERSDDLSDRQIMKRKLREKKQDLVKLNFQTIVLADAIPLTKNYREYLGLLKHNKVDGKDKQAVQLLVANYSGLVKK